MEYLNKYVNYMKQSGVYAGDQEIALTAYYLGININVLINIMRFIIIYSIIIICQKD